jgi:hypothetical protein
MLTVINHTELACTIIFTRNGYDVLTADVTKLVGIAFNPVEIQTGYLANASRIFTHIPDFAVRVQSQLLKWK